MSSFSVSVSTAIKGGLSQTAVDNAFEKAKIESISPVLALTQSGAKGPALAAACSLHYGHPLIDISAIELGENITEVVADDLIKKHHILPLRVRGRKLTVAIAEPSSQDGIKDIQFNTGLLVDVVIAAEPILSQRIDAFFQQKEEATGSGMDDLDSSLEDVELSADDGDEASDSGGGVDAANGADETPIVKFVNKVLLDAIRQGASDIHFEPYEKAYRVRFRTDGILREIARPPQNLSGRLAARLKVMSNMDISERRVPQDGRVKLKLSKSKAIDFRVNTLPTLFGEKICMRILDPSSAQMGIDMLGYEPEQKALYMKALEEPQGMILVTGPTGSGKTVSLYTGLNILNTPERNISTAEDPVEINLEGINQCNVNPRVGLDFGAALKSFLRQDPDIIMVGEIRDLDTGAIAIKAAQTGHMVMSTLHTNSAAETITRMLNMGIPAFNLATTVSLIIAQRLGRRLCKHCKEEHTDVPKEILLEEGFTEEQAETMTLYKANPEGCSNCTKGYKGRVGIYEVVKITPKISSIIMNNGNSIDIDKAAREEGFPNIRQSGLKKAADGLTTLEEVNRVTKD